MAYPVGEVLKPLVARLGLKKGLLEAEAVRIWPGAVGPLIAARSRADRAEGGLLFVTVSSPAWAQELALLKPALLDALNRALGEPVIQDIRFKSGRIWHAGKGPAPPAGAGGRPAMAPLLVEPRGINDPGLQKRFEGFIRAASARQAMLRDRGWKPCHACGALRQPDPPGRLCPLCLPGN